MVTIIICVELYTYRAYGSIIILMLTWPFCLLLSLHQSVGWSGRTESIRFVVELLVINALETSKVTWLYYWRKYFAGS